MNQHESEPSLDLAFPHVRSRGPGRIVGTVRLVIHKEMDQNTSAGCDQESRDWSYVDRSSVLLSTSREVMGCGECVWGC